MRDPFPFPPLPALSKAVEPLADLLAFPTLPLHVHEVLGAVLFYTFIQKVVSPVLSTYWFPKHYPRTSRGKRVNWDAHVVSLVQSTLINVLALWVSFVDEERNAMDWEQRIWGYDGACGMIQALACGYFVWDLIVTVCYLDVFGLGLLAHAVSALVVYSFGFRPFLNYYSCVFILYELSTPFLNIHWFFDKLDMTGSKAQLYNGIALLITFASCRLVYGTYQSGRVYGDMWAAIHSSPDAGYLAAAHANATLSSADEYIMAFATDATPVPLWLAGLYVVSNLVLNTLNWFWFVKMIAAVRKRFETPKDAKTLEKPLDGAASNATATDRSQVRYRRRNSIMDVIPDSDELRDGQIQ
ncbi:TRAM, LAG1 and CLN8 domain-containing protein [Cercophora scortea]|uniref:TRAM, LAG1 and CLN8 domain-containing protein n=1 Tax=Cercophora scortea TaxID=314031 RepID=A0AAE0J4Z5_9PEZI|nr:TRAM, LAG1 and CLN8 domain-containing protein [Cercophora scortea]